MKKKIISEFGNPYFLCTLVFQEFVAFLAALDMNVRKFALIFNFEGNGAEISLA